MKEKDIEKIEGVEGELNEELKEIQEKAELIKFKDEESKEISPEKLSSSGRESTLAITKTQEEYSKELEEILKEFPRAITNNELPERFYERFDNDLSKFFAELELVGIYKYHEKVVDFLERTPKLKVIPYFWPYTHKRDYDGEIILKDDPFSSYKDEERLGLLESNDRSVRPAVKMITHAQRFRVAFKKFGLDHDTFEFGKAIAHELFYGLDGIEKFISTDLLEKREELQKEEELENKPSSEDYKKLFPTKKDREKHQTKIANMALDFIEETATEIRQKMKENYEKQKK